MKSNSFTCRKATAADFSDWRKLARQLWPEFKLADFSKLFADIRKSPRYVSFICRTTAGKAIAFANVSLRVDYVEGSDSSPVGYLEGIFVAKDYRKMGIARLLVDAAERWAAAKGATEMGSDTEMGNAASQKFHQAIGFSQTEKIVHFIKKIRRDH